LDQNSSEIVHDFLLYDLRDAFAFKARVRFMPQI
jgi:hypothetical protein